MLKLKLEMLRLKEMDLPVLLSSFYKHSAINPFLFLWLGKVKPAVAGREEEETSHPSTFQYFAILSFLCLHLEVF